MASHLEQLEKQLRHAAASRRYKDVSRLAAECGEAVQAFVRALPKGDPRAGEAGRKLLDLLSWALVMTQAARATCLADLRRVATANRYSRRCGEPGRVSVQLDA
ncbi:MAG: hypothetical protein ABSH42_20135 [Bryobacteraceae bacterium]